MKIRLFYFGVLFTVSSAFISCQLEDSVGESTNYWDSNALTKNKLYGSVHIVVSKYMNYIGYIEFNREGNPISSYQTAIGYGISDTSTMSVEYADGKQVKYTYVPDTRHPSIKTITNFEYGNTGKYIPQASGLFSGTLSLIPSLSAEYSETSREDYIFYGSELWIVKAEKGLPNDTTVVVYSGNYPSSFSNRSFECNRIVYAKNGMILSYSVLDKGSSTQIVYTFLPDSKYELLDNVVTTDLRWENQTYRLYSYNNHKDLMEAVSDDDWSERYTNYTYDKHGNWTSRKSYYRPNGTQSDWEEYGSTTQKCTYY